LRLGLREPDRPRRTRSFYYLELNSIKLCNNWFIFVSINFRKTTPLQ
jgi:hypothetical protein